VEKEKVMIYTLLFNLITITFSKSGKHNLVYLKIIH